MEDQIGQDIAQKPPAGRRRGLLTGLFVLATVAGPFAIGNLYATERYGLAQPAIIGITALSGLLGFASRRMILGGLAGDRLSPSTGIGYSPDSSSAEQLR